MAHLHSDHAQEKTLQQQGAAQAMLLRQGLPTYMRRIVPMTAGWPNLRVWRARVGRYHKLQVRRSSGAQGLDSHLRRVRRACVGSHPRLRCKL